MISGYEKIPVNDLMFGEWLFYLSRIVNETENAAGNFRIPDKFS